MGKGPNPPWWAGRSGLDPLPVEITEEDFTAFARDVALLTGKESVVLGSGSSVRNLAWGFEIRLPSQPVAAVPGQDVRERTRAWKDAALGLLRGARTGDPVTVPLLAEDREALWLADLAVGGRILARCGIVAVENPAGQLERSARMVSRRLEALVWERAATAWERNLDRIVKGSVDGEASEDAAFRCRLDLLARETVRALGCSGAGLYTWREAWSGYVLDGYFGPPMEQRPAIENPSRPAQSGWWFHAAGEPSLVRSASGVDTDDRTGTPILVWRSDTKGEAEANPSAIAEFERTYPDDALQAALAVKLRIPEDPLRPVLVVFGTQSSPWCDWIDRIHRAWHGVLDDASGTDHSMERFYSRALTALERNVARTLQRRREHQSWKIARSGTAWPVEATTSRSEGKKILEGIRDLAGAYSGTLWAFHEGRRKALALLHPFEDQEKDADDHAVYQWHEPPVASGLEAILKRLRTSNRRIGLTFFEHRDGRWQKRFEDDDEWSEAASNTVRWLNIHAEGRPRITIGSARLERGDQDVGALTLAWRHPPLGREQLEILLTPVLGAVGASLALLVVLEEERRRAAREREFNHGIDVVFQRWLTAVRSGPVEGPLAAAPASYVADVVHKATEQTERTLHFLRYERWNHDQVQRGGYTNPVARLVAPKPDPEPHDLDKKLVETLVAAARRASRGEEVEPFEIKIQWHASSPSDGEGSPPERTKAVAFPAVVGSRISGFLAVEGRKSDLESELATWQSVALTIGYTADLVRRSVYRALDRQVAPNIFRALERERRARRTVDVVARALAGEARTTLGARWAAVVAPAAGRGVRIMAATGVDDSELAGITLKWEPLAVTRDRKADSCFAFDPSHPGAGGPQVPGNPAGTTAGLVAPLRSSGRLHGWLLTVTESSWSLDAARILEALALRAAPLLAHALETDRLFVGLASTQHAARSAWQQAYAGLDRLEIRLQHLRALDPETRSDYAAVEEGLDRAGARMASTLYLVTAGETEAAAGRDQATSFKELLDDVARMYRIMADDREVVINVQAPRSRVPVPGDVLLVRLVVENLLENAIKYARRGGQVRVRLIPKVGGVTTLEVVDVGRPFSKRTWEQYLEPFARLDAGEQGFGVGLWVVQDCCRRLGATLEPPDSRPLDGRTYRVVMRVHFVHRRGGS